MFLNRLFHFESAWWPTLAVTGIVIGYYCTLAVYLLLLMSQGISPAAGNYFPLLTNASLVVLLVCFGIIFVVSAWVLNRYGKVSRSHIITILSFGVAIWWIQPFF